MSRRIVYLAVVSTVAVCFGACEVMQDIQRANRINSMQAVGGRAVYQRQRLEWLNRQLGELELVHPDLRENQKRLLEQAIQDIASDYTEEIGGENEFRK